MHGRFGTSRCSVLIDVPDKQAALLLPFRALLVAGRDQVLLHWVPGDAVARPLLLPLVYEALDNAIGHVVVAVHRQGPSEAVLPTMLIFAKHHSVFCVDQQYLACLGARHDAAELLLAVGAARSGKWRPLERPNVRLLDKVALLQMAARLAHHFEHLQEVALRENSKLVVVAGRKFHLEVLIPRLLEVGLYDGLVSTQLHFLYFAAIDISNIIVSI